MLTGLYLTGLAANLIVLALASFTRSATSERRRRWWTWGLLGAALWPIVALALLLHRRAELRRLAKALKAR